MSRYASTSGATAPDASPPGALIRRRQALGALAALCATVPASGAAQVSAPAELRAWLPLARLSGSTRLLYWGLALYDASLWVQAGFDVQQFERFGFALQLDYLRDFTHAALSDSAVEEMARQSAPTPEQRELWRQWLQEAFPAVHQGDRITGIHLPGRGALFLTNGRETGRVADAVFARLFFGIWLSTRTSQPAMRRALLANSAAP